jgi:hypothetical protein
MIKFTVIAIVLLGVHAQLSSHVLPSVMPAETISADMPYWLIDHHVPGPTYDKAINPKTAAMTVHFTASRLEQCYVNWNQGVLNENR